MAGETWTGLLTNGVENANDLIQERIDLYNGFEGSALTKHLKFEIAECLPEASFRQGKMTMANFIENRVPLLDNDVVDLLMSLPEDMLVRFVSDSPAGLSSNPFEWMQGKFILKKIVEKNFGKEFAFRKKAIMNIDASGSLLRRTLRIIFTARSIHLCATEGSLTPRGSNSGMKR